MPPRTGSGWRRSSPRPRRRAPTTTSRSRRSSPTRRSSGATRPRASARSARTSTPRRDPLRDLEPLGREHGQLVAHGRRHGAPAHGRGGLRRLARRQLGAERADLGGSPRRRQRARQRPRVPPRAVRGRRVAADARAPRSSSASGSARATSPSTRTRCSWLADSAFWTDMATYVSDWSQEVYGDLRATPSRRARRRAPRVPQRLPPAQARARGAGPRDRAARAFLREAYSPLANAPGRARPHGAGRWFPSSRWRRTSRRR